MGIPDGSATRGSDQAALPAGLAAAGGAACAAARASAAWIRATARTQVPQPLPAPVSRRTTSSDFPALAPARMAESETFLQMQTITTIPRALRPGLWPPGSALVILIVILNIT